ncbi:MAG: flagellar hook capping FlgD N-terminal domain-containing protein [Phycisphaerales bacterium]
MADVTGVGGTSGSSSTASRASGFNSLSSADFIKIMTTELSRQDPLSPTDSKAILDQISSIRSIESNISLKDSIQSMVQQNEFASAGALIGKVVYALDDDAVERIGVIQGVSNTREGARVIFKTGHSAFVRNILQIAENTPTAGSAT